MRTVLAKSTRVPNWEESRRRITQTAREVENLALKQALQFAPTGDRDAAESVLRLGKLGYGGYRESRKWERRVKNIVALLDREARTAATFDLAGEASISWLKRYLPAATRHPYFAYHQAHMKILAACITAVDRVALTQKLLDDALAKLGRLQAQIHRTLEQHGDPSAGPRARSMLNRRDALVTGQWIYRGSLENLPPRELKTFVAAHGGEFLQFLTDVWRFERDVGRHAEELIWLLALAKQEMRAVEFLLQRVQERVERHQASNVFERLGGSFVALDLEMEDTVIVSMRSAVEKLSRFVNDWAQSADDMSGAFDVAGLFELTNLRLARLR